MNRIRLIALALVVYAPFVAILYVGGCATGGSAKGTAAKPYLVVHAALKAISEAEPRLVCGRPTAAPAPACIPLEAHHDISRKIEQAAEIDLQANAIIKNLPEGQPQPADLIRLIMSISTAIDEILSQIPSGPTKASLQKLAEIK